MAIDDVGSQKEVDYPEDFEGFEDDTPAELNVVKAHGDDFFEEEEENPDYYDDINGSDPSTTILKEFENGVNSDERPIDEWIKEDDEVLEEEEEDSY